MFRIELLFLFGIFFMLQIRAQSKFPEIQLTDLENGRVLSGTLLQDSVPIILTFWSTTCKPCIQELDEFSSRWVEWKKQVSFKIVAISTDDARSLSKVRNIVAAHEWPFHVLLDKNQDFKRAWNVQTIPQLFVLDRTGKVVFSRIGYTPGNEQQIIEILKKL